MTSNYPSLADKIPFWHFEDSFMAFEDGSLGASFKIQGIDISCQTNEFKNEVSNYLENALKSLPSGYRVQIFYNLTPNVHNLISAHSELSQQASDSYQEVRKARVDFFEENRRSGVYFQPCIHIFLRGLPFQLKKNGLLSKQKKYSELTKKEYDLHHKSFARSVDTLLHSFKEGAFSIDLLSKEEWFSLLFTYMNPDRSFNIGVPDLKGLDNPFAPSVNEQLCLSDLEVHRNFVRVGETLVRVISLGILPEGETYPTMIENLTSVPFHFQLSQTIQISDPKKEMEKLGVQRKLTHSMASGNNNLSDLESESKLSDIEELMNELLEGSEKLVQVDLKAIISGKDEDELQEKSDTLLRAFRNMGQAEGVVETYPGLEAFLSSIPGSCQLFRPKKVKSSNAVHLMPLYGPWQGHERPVCLIANSNGGLTSIDPFDSSLLNYNGLVFGGSGAGKSFTLCQIMLMFYGQTPSPKIIWVDNGASSKRLLDVLGGEFIDLNINSSIRLNLFDLEKDQYEPSPSKVKLILAVLETIFKDEERIGLPKKEKAMLEEAIFHLYRNIKGRFPTLSDLKTYLGNHKSKPMQDFSEILYSWTGNTPYGRLLDGESNVELSKDLVTIEIKGLDDYPDLQNVFLLLFTDYIKSQASADINTPYILIIDEAWKLFETPSGLSFTLEAYRTFRKYKASIICISQNYADFLSTPEIRKALYPNTAFLFILKQQVDDWKDFQERLNLNDAEAESVKDIKVVKGQYSEFFFKQNDKKAILRMSVDPLAYWICTSDADDKTKIKNVQQENPEWPLIDVLKYLAYQKN